MEQLRTLVLVAILVGLTSHLLDAESMYYVKPTDSQESDSSFDPDDLCPVHAGPCFTLQHYLQNDSFSFVSNTRFEFLPGIHVLDMGPGDTFVPFNNLINITIAGSEISRQMQSGELGMESEVWCLSRVGFLFAYVENLSIQHLALYNCSAKLLNLQFALGLFSLVNTRISHVLIQKSRGYGILGINVLGASSISDSMVLSSWADLEDYAGGNALLAFDTGEDDCFRLRNDTVRFSVKSSSFAYGNVTKYGLIPGLSISIENPCSNSYVEVYNSSFHDNHNWNGTRPFGKGDGNLNINIFEHKNTSNYIIIDKCNFWRGVSAVGGGIAISILQTQPNIVCYSETSPTNVIHITNTNITSNSAYSSGGGLVVYSSYINGSHSCHHRYLLLRGVLFEDNESRGLAGGGNALLAISPNKGHYTIEITDCTFKNGRCYDPVSFGGGLALLLISADVQKNDIDQVFITQTNFLDNIAEFGGGAAIFADAKGLGTFGIYKHKLAIDTVMINCTFSNNSASLYSALFVSGNYDLRLPTTAFFRDLAVFNNRPDRSELCPQCDSKAIGFIDVRNVTCINGHFHNNKVGAITLSRSNLFLGGNISFRNNTSFNGAGIDFCTDSYMYFKEHVFISFANNHARHAGGAIYVSSKGIRQCSSRPRDDQVCFFNLDLSYSSLPSISSQVTFANNTAEHAGTALYGGFVEYCVFRDQVLQDMNAIYSVPFEDIPNLVNETSRNEYVWGPDLFDLLFKFNESGLSVVSSDPSVVCFCENDYPNCTKKLRHATAYPGKTLTITAVAVGQRDGVVPAVVVARFADSSISRMLDNFQVSQEVGGSCTKLNYTVFSDKSFEKLTLGVETTEIPEYIYSDIIPPTLLITLFPCPPGFTLRGPSPQFKCDCADELVKLATSCNIDQSTIHRPAGMWISFYDSNISAAASTSFKSLVSGVLLHKHCPFDYCKSEGIDVVLNDSDKQCAFNRSGILCGACKPGLSLMLATSRCLGCSNTYLMLVLVFFLAGMFLVFILTALNLTVAEGTIGGLVFYANIVHVNKVIFFQSKSTDFFSVFIAWLNLDLGIETCFYDGMDVYARTWMQFAFPLYIWGIVMFMILSSHYSTKAAKLFGRNNSVRVLATLLLLSYTKILRTIITAVSFTTITYPDESVDFVWLADANIQYLTGKHIPLFLVALVFLVFSLLYTALLLFLQCLWPRSHHSFLFWMRRIKPFLDAHTGAYKDKYRFWPGLLLLSRILLFVALAVNSLGDLSLNLLFVSVMLMCLFGFKWIASGIYKNWLLDILEASFFINLGGLSVSSLYIQSNGSLSMVQNIISGVFIGLAFAAFFGILVYHLQKYMPHIVMRMRNCLTSCCTWKRHGLTTDDAELDDLVTGNDSNQTEANNVIENNAVSGESLAGPPPKVQCLRLTFDRNATAGEAILVEDAD